MMWLHKSGKWGVGLLALGIALNWLGTTLQTQAGDAITVASVSSQTLPGQKTRPEIWVARIQGTIDPASANYLRTSIQRAEQNHAEFLVVELDTPGGLVSSVQDMAQAIDQSNVPVIVYVTPAGASATSAGALLTLASHVAAMAPGTHIGAAHPVDTQGKDIPGAMGQKAANDAAAFARSLAEVRGRNRDVAEAVVLKSRSLTSQEALKENLIEVIADSRTDLLEKMDGRKVQLRKGVDVVLHTNNAEVRSFEMSFGQKILHFIANPNVATLLMSVGMLCIYAELTTPGAVIPGVLGGILILIGFMAFQMLPIRTGGLLLLLLGIAFWIAEPFVTSHGALALGGTLAFILGTLWLFDPSVSDLKVSPSVWVPAAIGLGAIGAIVAYAATHSRTLVRRARAEMGGGDEFGLRGYQGRVESVEADGKRGKILVRGEIWDFESEEPLKLGDIVEIKEPGGKERSGVHAGMRVRVQSFRH